MDFSTICSPGRLSLPLSDSAAAGKFSLPKIRPSSAALGLSSLTSRAVPVNGLMETAVPGIFAVGDVTGRPMLAHVATAQGALLAERLAGGGREMDYRALPWAVFTTPEVATARVD